MITGWLVKLVLGIAVVGFLLIELGTPLIVRTQLDGIAHESADQAGFALRNGGNAEAAEAAAVEQASKDKAEVTEFAITPEGEARVTVRKEAKSYLFKKWDRTKGWYDLKASATSQGSKR
ncbi:MAG TPA: hypothetical protein VGB03_07585 [Acidimicrobiales bacterium]